MPVAAAVVGVASVATSAVAAKKGQDAVKKQSKEQIALLTKQEQAATSEALAQRRAAENEQVYAEAVRALQTSAAQIQASAPTTPILSNNALGAVGAVALVAGVAGIVLATRPRRGQTRS